MSEEPEKGDFLTSIATQAKEYMSLAGVGSGGDDSGLHGLMSSGASQ